MIAAQKILERLEGVQKAGNGWRAKCPACGGKGRKVSIAEAQNGTVLLHCFAGCGAAAVLESVGLAMSDLFPEPIKPQTPDELRAFRRDARQTQWSAALEVLTTECIVVLLAARDIGAGRDLAEADIDRLALACSRIDYAALVLTERKEWRPDYCYPPESLARMKRCAADELNRQHSEAEQAAQRAEMAIPCKVAA